MNLALCDAKPEMRPLAVPEPQSGRGRERPEYPQVPDRRAVPQQVTAITDAIERTDPNVDAVRDQAESGKEAQDERAGHANGRGNTPDQERCDDSDDRPRPRDEQRLWILTQVGP